MINATGSQALGYDSNAVGQPHPGSSLLLQTDAAVQARSNWGRDSLNFVAGVDNRRYPAQPEQSTVNWNASTGGTYEFGRDQLGLNFSHIKASQTPRDLSAPLLTAPASYTVDAALASYTTGFNRFTLVPSVEFGLWRYEDVMTAGVPLTYQNRNVVTANLVGRYQASEQRGLLVILRGTHNLYVTPVAGQPSRDSDGIDVLVGVEYAAGAVWRYRALAGFQHRQYSSSAFQPLNSPALEANVIWQPTGLTSVTASVLHTVAESTLTDNTNYTLSQARLTFDHELRRNILLQAHAEIDKAAYPGNVGDATLVMAGVSVTWLMNRRLRVVGSYDYSTRESGPSSYSEHVALVRFGFGL